MSTEQEDPIPWITPWDVRRLLVLAGGALFAMVVPRRAETAVVGALVRAYFVLRQGEVRKVARRLEDRLPGAATCGPEALAQSHLRMRLEDFWGRLRGIGPFRWRPRVEIEGEERIREALAGGRGVVLWMMRLGSATAAKQAFHAAGFPLTHLSRAQHGAYSDTRFAAAVVSPLFCRAEAPYLAERIKIPLDGSLGYIADVRDRLRRNACVSIFGEHRGRQNVAAPFLGGSMRFATGAPSLAWLEGSALLTVYVLRTGPFAYRVVVDEPLAVDRTLGRKEFARRAALEFGRRLEERIHSHPTDWQGWSYWEALEIESAPAAERPKN